LTVADTREQPRFLMRCYTRCYIYRPGLISWLVVTAPIPAADWVEVRNVAMGEILLEQETK
jgi:hypothetical protein